jgi:N-acetylglucosamine-6-phosphate deacetylase
MANLIGIHFEGRYLNPEKKGAHNPEYLALPSINELNSLSQAMMPAPLHFSIAPELENGEEFIKKAVEIGATVGIAHTNSTYEQALEALSWGAKSFTHTFNAMTSIHHRMPGATTCALTENSAYAEVICDGMHLHPAIVKLIYLAKPKDKMVLITDSMAATASPDGNYSIAGSAVTVKNGVAVDANGTLAGSTLTLFKGMTNLMKFCNIPLIHAIKYATINPAKMVNADFIGKIEKGYRADFIVISNPDAPEIHNVYVGANKIEQGA